MGATLIDEQTADANAVLTRSFAEARLIAVDAEGVDLSREGVISIVQIATRQQCFILDVLGKGPEHPVVVWLRAVLEDASITKIIHDCRMDADAFQHHLAICLTNVHDTACWHSVLTGLEDQNLNNTLAQNGLQPNIMRSKGVYDANPAFWAVRPLTPQMLGWASGDLDSLFDLYDKVSLMWLLNVPSVGGNSPDNVPTTAFISPSLASECCFNS